MVVLVAAACGGDGGTDAPFRDEFLFSFETGFEGWRADSADFCEPDALTGLCPEGGAYAPTDVDVVTGTAVHGARSVRLFAVNDTDAVKLWIERAFAVPQPGRYRVLVSWELGTSDLDIGAWTSIGAAVTHDPSAAVGPGDPPERVGDFLRLDPTAGTGGLQFRTHGFGQDVEVGAGREVWVGVGVWGTFEVEREYFIDRVRVEILEIS